MKSNYLYLALDIFSIFFPLAFSFYPKANFSKNWRQLPGALLIPAAVFIAWDMAFTRIGIWGFNPEYLLGIYIYNLPVEEVFFFICIPYACIFSYDALNHFVKRDVLASMSQPITILLIVVLLSLGFMNLQRGYTCITFLSTASFLALLEWRLKAAFLSRFYFMFCFILLPFFLINGILTGSVTDDPVVWYNPDEMLGFRIGTIPFEDVFYGMLLLLMNVYFFERARGG